MLRFFPALAGRRIEQAWGGPIDVSPSHLPVIAEVEPRIHCAFGYTGHGVGPSHLLGRSLASLALGIDDEASRLALINPPAVRVPPEPFRYLGGSLIRRAILRQESAMERGERPGSRHRRRRRDPGADRDPHRQVGRRRSLPRAAGLASGPDCGDDGARLVWSSARPERPARHGGRAVRRGRAGTRRGPCPERRELPGRDDLQLPHGPDHDLSGAEPEPVRGDQDLPERRAGQRPGRPRRVRRGLGRRGLRHQVQAEHGRGPPRRLADHPERLGPAPASRRLAGAGRGLRNRRGEERVEAAPGVRLQGRRPTRPGASTT